MQNLRMFQHGNGTPTFAAALRAACRASWYHLSASKPNKHLQCAENTVVFCSCSCRRWWWCIQNDNTATYITSFMIHRAMCLLPQQQSVSAACLFQCCATDKGSFDKVPIVVYISLMSSLPQLCIHVVGSNTIPLEQQHAQKPAA